MIEIEKSYWKGFYAFLAEKKPALSIQGEADVFVYDMSECVNSYTEEKVRTLLESEVCPGIAIYQALVHTGVSEEEAVALLDEYLQIKLKSRKSSYGRTGSLHRLVGKFPALVYRELQSRGEGWQKQWVYDNETRVQCNVTVCLYHSVCEKYECPALVRVFCHAERAVYEAMGAEWRFEAAHTLAAGDGFCDLSFVKRG